MSSSRRHSPILGSSRGKVHPKLLRDLTLLLLTIVILLWCLAYFFGSELRKEFASELIGRTAADAGRELKQLFLVAEEFLDVVQQWGQDGALAEESPDQLRARMLPLLEKIPQVSGMMLADDQGSEFFLVRDEGHWFVRVTRQENGRSIASWSPGKPSEAVSPTTYDPRQRPWFVGVAKRQEPGLFWTAPYRFNALQKTGITGSVKWQHNGRVYVGAVDLLLESVVEKLAEAPLGESGEAFLLGPRGKILLSSTGAGEDSVDSAPVRMAAAQWQVVEPEQRSFFTFPLAGQTWLGGYVPEGAYWVGVTVPESFFAGEMSRQRRVGLLLAVLIGLLGVVGIFFLLRRHSKQTTSLPRKVDSVRLRQLVARGEGAALEFKSTMRTNLKSGKQDKAIELAWLKTVVAFLNGQGGIILLGVDDAGQLLGLAADEFSNNDRCRLHFKNLLNQHVGADFSDRVDFDLVEVQGIMVGVVRCSPAPRPVFLKHGQSEEFYIRSGPASVQLTGSQLLSYLQHR